MERLQILLETKKWQEANNETAKIMLDLAGQTDKLSENALDIFPCTSLITATLDPLLRFITLLLRKKVKGYS